MTREDLENFMKGEGANIPQDVLDQTDAQIDKVATKLCMTYIPLVSDEDGNMDVPLMLTSLAKAIEIIFAFAYKDNRKEANQTLDLFHYLLKEHLADWIKGEK